MVYHLLDNLLGGLLFRWAKKLPNCSECKITMQKDGEPLLFLIPVFQDHTYTESVEYYQKNCRPISSTKEIPTGQRACRFWTLTCPDCGRHQLLVEDFLQVRDAEVVEKRCLYDYAEFDLAQMLARSTAECNQ